MMQKYCFILTAVILSLYGCKRDNPVNSTIKDQPDVIYPLALGNRWDYQLIQYDTLGIAKDTSFYSKDIPSDTIISNEHWFLLSEFFYGINRSDGLYVYFTGSGQSHLYFKYPTSVGDTVYAEPSKTDEYLKTMSVSDSIELNGKMCIAYRYEIKYTIPWWNSNNYERYYLISKIGLVQEETRSPYLDSLNRVVARAKLISYTLN